jgi:hypothetical protein
MGERAGVIAAFVAGIAGLGLIGYETVQALRGIAITTLGTTLTYGGLGLVVIAAVLVVVSLTSEPDPVGPADAGPPAASTAEPVSTE